MEEVVNEIMEYIRKKTEDFTYLDQSQIYEEIAGNVSDMNADAMKKRIPEQYGLYTRRDLRKGLLKVKR